MAGASGGARYLCAECGRDLSGVALSVACVCGSSYRLRVDSDGVFRRPATVDAPRYDPFKDWSIKYLQFDWNVRQLRRSYLPGSGALLTELRRAVELTFASCAALADWLASGAEPQDVTPGDVERLVREEPLSVATALAAGGNAARLVPVMIARQSRCWVEYRRPVAKPLRYDALDLSERCLRTWRGFLAERGVAAPSWVR